MKIFRFFFLHAGPQLWNGYYAINYGLNEAPFPRFLALGGTALNNIDLKGACEEVAGLFVLC